MLTGPVDLPARATAGPMALLPILATTYSLFEDSDLMLKRFVHWSLSGSLARLIFSRIMSAVVISPPDRQGFALRFPNPRMLRLNCGPSSSSIRQSVGERQRYFP